MAINIVEKNALSLNQILRTDGKRLGKEWRLRIRTLLGETFAALNAKPLDGALCLQLSEKIEAELAALAEMKGDAGEDDGLHGADAPAAGKSAKKKKSRKKSEADAAEPPASETDASDASDASDEWWAQEAEGASPKQKKSRRQAGAGMCADEPDASGGRSEDARMGAPEGRIGEADSPEDMPRIGEADSGGAEARIGEADSAEDTEVPAEAENMVAEGAVKDAPAESVPEEAGLFDLIHVQIRCFFKINACVRPPYIGKFVQFADKFSEVKEARIERFIRVLSKGDEEISMKTEVEVGYRDDLIPDMPEMGFVLHPKKKKKR